MDEELRTGEPATGPRREPLLNAPWPSVAVVLVILASYAVQLLAGGQSLAMVYGFAPADLDHGRLVGLLAVMFLHGGWIHAIMNALGALAFGPPVARLLGPGVRGALAFFGFYLLCGVVSSLGYAVLHLHQAEPVIGASGAVSGLMGAAARLIGRRWGLNPLNSRPVVSLTLSWVAVNALMAVAGAPLIAGARVAWEAHIAGFVAGALLIGPWRALTAPRVEA
jgi:membrane associated rhomboid family serine protease